MKYTHYRESTTSDKIKYIVFLSTENGKVD